MYNNITIDEAPLKQKAYKVYSKEDEENEYYNNYDVRYFNNINKLKKEFAQEMCINYIDVRVKRFPEMDKVFFEGEYKTQEKIDSIVNTRKYKKELENFLKEHGGKKCYIYSSEWNLYWRSNSSGYTSKIKEVGVYKVEEAVDIALACGISKQLSLELIK